MKRIFYFLMAFVAIVLSSCGDKKAAPAPADEGYKVGDYYCDSVKEGIVFEVYDGGKHGKIVSLDEGTAKWAVRALAHRATDATSSNNGMVNLNEIKNLSNWETNYPAFAWCASLGDGWYLPSRDELLLIYENRVAVNNGLVEKGRNKMSQTFHWSSSEMENELAWGCGFSEDSFLGGNGYDEKHLNESLRAVCAF